MKCEKPALMTGKNKQGKFGRIPTFQGSISNEISCHTAEKVLKSERLCVLYLFLRARQPCLLQIWHLPRESKISLPTAEALI